MDPIFINKYIEKLNQKIAEYQKDSVFINTQLELAIEINRNYEIKHKDNELKIMELSEQSKNKEHENLATIKQMEEKIEFLHSQITANEKQVNQISDQLAEKQRLLDQCQIALNENNKQLNAEIQHTKKLEKQLAEKQNNKNINNK